MSKKSGKRASKNRPDKKTTHQNREPIEPATSSRTKWIVIGVVAVVCVVIGMLAIPNLLAPKSDSADSKVADPGVPDTDSTTETSLANNQSSASPDVMHLPVLPGLDENRFDAVVRDVSKREDPVLDGWDTERLNDLANMQLKIIGKLLSHPEEIDDGHLKTIASSTVSTAGIRPRAEQLETAYADKTVTVNRGTTNEGSEQQGLGQFADAMKWQASLVRELHDHRFKFKVVRVDRDEKTFTTRSYFQISGRDDKRSAQANSIWTVRWSSGGKGEPPLVERIDVENYEEIHLSAPGGQLFADCTESVFRNSDRFGRQLIYGIDHWTDRFDGAIARPAAGHGIAIGDVNNDGLDDVYLCQSPGLPNLLLIQNPDGTVTDRAVEAGVNWLEGTRAALLADLDNDGDQDLVAVLGSKVVIQANDGKGNFTLKSIVDAVSSLFQINALDYDNDRDLDLFICGYTLTSGVNVSDVFANPMPFHDANNGAPNVLLRNDGEWAFTDVTKQVGLDENNMRFSYASAWEDYDQDGDLDVYVANDFGRNNLYRNDNGTFHDVAPELGVEDIGPGMSAAWGDFNNDGRPDIYVSNMFSSAGNRITHQQQFKTGINEEEKKLFQRHARGNSLFENVGDTFKDRSVDLGVTLGRWAWGSQFVDMNNDGWQDIYVTNGFITADNNNDL
ncbi:MAG: VCBS repeat-containing protein [Planctomycetales bacterium]|nr:VCBS repeat-containing protein [Planctomycetales bacterium]